MNQKNTYSRLVILTFWLLLLAQLLGAMVFAVLELILLKWGYESVVTFLLQLLHQEDKRQQFVSGYFTFPLFTQLRILLPVGFGLLLVSSGYYWSKRNWVKSILGSVEEGCRDFILRFVRPILALSASYKLLLLATFLYVLYSRIMVSAGLPFHIDEMHSWLYFVDKGFLVSWSYYPSPNNHVLFSMLACVTDLFVDDPFLIMRVTSISIGMMLSLLVFRFLLSYCTYPFALLGMLLFSFAPVIQQYSVLGRGYGLETGFFILAFWSFLKLIQDTQSHPSLKYSVLFVLSSTLATFTLITYLYALVGFALIGSWYFRVSGKAFVRWVLHFVVIGVLVSILYTPLLLFSGLSSIAANSWIIRPDWSLFLSQLGSILQNHAEYFIAIPYWSEYIFVGIWGFILLVLVRSEYRTLLIVSLSLMVIGFSICVIQRIVPYERMWTHFLFCQQVLLTLAVYHLVKKWRNNRFLNASLPALFFISQIVLGLIPKEKHADIYDRSEAVSEKILSLDPKVVFCQEYVYFNYLSVHARVNKQSVLIDNEGQSDIPDFVVQDKLLSWPEKLDKNQYYQWMECDEFVCIYRRKP